jgi:hypothetical protein
MVLLHVASATLFIIMGNAVIMNKSSDNHRGGTSYMEGEVVNRLAREPVEKARSFLQLSREQLRTSQDM